MTRLRATVWLISLVSLVGALSLTAGVASAAKVTLLFPSWQWGQPGYDDFFKEAIAAFQAEHPDVEIRPVPIPQEKYDEQLIVRFSAKNPPEVLQWTLWNFHAFARSGFLEPLDERLARTDIPAEWIPAFQDFTRVDGKTYGIMLSGSAQMLYYNKQMLDAAGVRVPTTPEELVEAARKLTRRDPQGNVTQYGFSTVSRPVAELSSYGLGRFITGLGGNLGANGRPNANSPEVRRAVELYKELIASGAVAPGLGRIDARQMFWEGRAAMLIEGPWVMTSIQRLNPALMPNVGLAPIPFPYQIADASNGMAIGVDQKYKDLSWEFILMITSKRWMDRYGELTGVIPARRGSLTARALQTMPWMTEFAKIAAVGRAQIPEGLEHLQNEINNAVATRLAPVLFGTKPVDVALQELQKDMEAMVR